MTILVPAYRALVRRTHCIQRTCTCCTRVIILSLHYTCTILYIIAVIGFETGSVEVSECSPNEREFELALFTPRNVLSDLILASTLKVTVAVNQTLSTATLGNPTIITRIKGTTPLVGQGYIYFFHTLLGADLSLEVNTIESTLLSNLPRSRKLEVIDDNITEGTEEFVLEVISAGLIQSSSGESLEVSVINSLTVTIHDNDGRLCKLVLYT